MSLDMFEGYPKEMLMYLNQYGFHFNRKAYEFAVSKMRKKDASGQKKKVEPVTKNEVEELMQRHSISLENDTLYDAAYVATMGKADYYGSSIEDEQHLARYVKDTIDDVDAKEGAPFVCWYAKMMYSGEPIDWSDLL